ncbi:MAG: hypothetical protein QXH07_06140 [Thermoplasmata archaeon]
MRNIEIKEQNEKIDKRQNEIERIENMILKDLSESRNLKKEFKSMAFASDEGEIHSRIFLVTLWKDGNITYELASRGYIYSDEVLGRIDLLIEIPRINIWENYDIEYALDVVGVPEEDLEKDAWEHAFRNITVLDILNRVDWDDVLGPEH